MLRCLAKSPAERYPSAMALRVALQAGLRASEHAGWPRRAKVLLVGIAALTAALAVTAWRQRIADRPEAPLLPAAPRSDSRPQEGVPGPHPGPASDPVVETLFADGAVLENQGDYEQAIAHYDQVIARDPRHFMAHASRGFALHQLGHHLEAIAALGSAIALDPGLPQPYYNRGLARGALSRLREAIEDFDQAIALDPRLASAYAARSVVRMQLGEPAEAIPDCDRAIALDPQNAVHYFHRGALRESLRQYEQAIEDFDQALERRPAPQLAGEIRKRRARAQAGAGR